MNNLYQQALTAMPVEDVEFILSQLPAPVLKEPEPPSQDQEVEHGTDVDEETRRRRRFDREWPEIGTELWAEYFGVRYTADVFPANKKLKSGKQIRITSGPALGTVCDSFSEAMIIATEEQRQKQFLGRKGTSNGWLFWEWPGKPDNIAGASAEEPDEE